MKATDARSLHGQVVRELGTRIVAGDLKPGDVLPREDALAESMQVSRNALREALKVLSAKGLIEARPKTGTRIRPMESWNQLDPDCSIKYCYFSFSACYPSPQHIQY